MSRMLVSRFSDVVRPYPVVFLDAYGVLKNYEGVLPGVPQLIEALEQQGKDLYVVTNDASRSPERMARAYTLPGHGELIGPEQFVTSGMLVTDWLEVKVRRGTVAFLGKPDSAYYIDRAGLIPKPISACSSDEAVQAIALLDDEGFDWQADLNRALNMLRRHNVPVIIANADPAYPVSSDDIAVAVGSLGDLLERLVQKRFIRFGKPDALMFSHAFVAAQKKHPGLRKQDVLMVGDTLETDILGGNKFGLDTALVLSGNTQGEDADLMIRSTGIIPNYVCSAVTS